MRPKNNIVCTSDKPENIITQPDLSRTVRQILRDTIEGRPSPTPLTGSIDDSKVHKDKDLHKLHVCEDRFDAINRQRDYVKSLKAKIDDNKSKMKEYQRMQKEEYNNARRELSIMKSNVRRDEELNAR